MKPRTILIAAALATLLPMALLLAVIGATGGSTVQASTWDSSGAICSPGGQLTYSDGYGLDHTLTPGQASIAATFVHVAQQMNVPQAGR
ncbi:MAG TPA: hypothetical protein VK816_01805 [Jatrophihabitantaceae bacterium]|jgi:hypothetical protein|nr:hypothetical protein [Jatrophihabitantaceae bacterium]